MVPCLVLKCADCRGFVPPKAQGDNFGFVSHRCFGVLEKSKPLSM